MGGGPQAELLRRIAHWLMQEPELEENALTARVENGRLTIERRTIEDGAAADVTVTDPDGLASKLRLTPAGPGRGTATCRPGTPACGRSRTACAPPTPRPARPTRWNWPICARPPRCSGRWRGPPAAACTGSTPAAPARGVPELRRTEPDRDASGGAWVGLRAGMIIW